MTTSSASPLSAAAPADAGAPQAHSTDLPAMILPLTGAPAVRAFDGPPQPWLPGHRGVDLGARAQDVVIAPADGTVAFAGVVAGKPVVSLDHAGGIRTTYEPVTALLRAGDRVGQGQVIGRITGPHPGCPRQFCLHWGARLQEVADSYFDPLSLVDGWRSPIVLKPL